MAQDFKISEFTTATVADGNTYLAGVQNTGGGGYDDQKFTVATLASAIISSSSKMITCGADGVTITDPYLDASVIELSVSGASLLVGQDFTISGGVATLLNSTVFIGQKILARK